MLRSVLFEKMHCNHINVHYYRYIGLPFVMLSLYNIHEYCLTLRISEKLQDLFPSILCKILKNFGSFYDADAGLMISNSGLTCRYCS